MTTLALPPAPAPLLLRTPAVRAGEVAGIIIRDAFRIGSGAPPAPRVQAFVYGECEPRLPVLPFGRWRSREAFPVG